MEDKILTLTEVSKYLKIARSTVYKLCENGQMPCSKIGKQLRFRKSSLDNWLTQKENSKLKAIPALKEEEKPKHILLIDDDTLVLRTLARLLASHGYSVQPAQSGEDALEKARNHRFDLVITDIRMPGIDGIETIERLRELHRGSNRPAVPEIIITGFIDSQAEQKAQALGIKDYLYKPFTTPDFIETVREKLN